MKWIGESAAVTNTNPGKATVIVLKKRGLDVYVSLGRIFEELEGRKPFLAALRASSASVTFFGYRCSTSFGPGSIRFRLTISSPSGLGF